jgi:hypothetical protein
MVDDKKDDDEPDDLTPAASPLAKRPKSSTRHIAMKPCPECIGNEITHPDCQICNNQRFTNDSIKLATWDLRKTLKDYTRE